MDNKPNIIMIGTDLNLQGGISEVESEYLRAGLEQKVNLIFIPSHTEGSIFLRKIPIFLKSVKTYLFLPNRNQTIVHMHMSHGGSFFRKLILMGFVKLKKQKMIVHLHGSDFEEFMQKSKLHAFLTRLLFDKSDHIIVLSNLWKKLLKDFTSNPNITTLYNPTPKRDISHHGKGNIKVLFLGYLGERKGVYDLLEIITRSKDYFANKQITFVLAGNGEIDKVQKIIEERQLQDIVEVPGWVSGNQKEAYYKDGHFLVLPSYNEQMPMSILEAMSHGYPILASNVAGIPEMVEHGVNGFLFNPGDLDVFEKYLRQLCDDENLRDTMGLNSKQLVLDKFETGLILEELVDIYKQIQKAPA